MKTFGNHDDKLLYDLINWRSGATVIQEAEQYECLRLRLPNFMEKEPASIEITFHTNGM